MDVIKQNIAEIDSAIIIARQWLKEASTDKEKIDRQSRLTKLESDRATEQARLETTRRAQKK
ncbi:hypothetical protein F5Y16DRAFT_400301 [Xylariaceae sp. FL0255]|nr:hypothetical protein F5Y16DRAFT_400301 [Xylariaceae sp. FL0255]